MTVPAPTALQTGRYERARRGVGLAFVVAGYGFASFVARTPSVKRGLHLDASSLGLLLVSVSVGAMTGMPLTGPIMHRLGAVRGLLLGAALEAVGFAGITLGLGLGSYPITALALYTTGIGISIWDVAMNVEGAAVERLLDRTIMSRFHAGFSLGTICGAAIGASSAAVGLPLPAQLAGTSVVMAVFGIVAARMFMPTPPPDDSEKVTSRSLLWQAWTTPRTLIVGVMVLAFAFTEGVANDWTALAVVDGLGRDEALGAIAFAAFVTSMTVGRLIGSPAIDRWGRVPVLRGSAALAAAGVLVFVTAPGLIVAMLGSVLWGLGAAIGFPTGISASADDPRVAAIHVSVVSTIGYSAFLIGPPLVGFLADHVGVRPSLYVVLAALALAFGTAYAARPLEGDQPA